MTTCNAAPVVVTATQATGADGALASQCRSQLIPIPGVYVMDGNGLTIDSASATVTGSGVSFYNTATSGYSYGTLTISGQPNVTFSAPTSGAMEGITIYIPKAPLLYTGQSSTGSYTGLVVNTLQINGSTNFKQDPTGGYTGLGGGRAVAYLIE